MHALLPHLNNLDGYHFERRKEEQNSCQILVKRNKATKQQIKHPNVCNVLPTHTLITLRCEDFICEMPSLEAFLQFPW